ncbi:MAG: ABC transporter ATP-binding protein [Alphaproteobacteria bacterium]|nr:ABC transporter ATP-binding protein [Alphaproteobacteria bacterium]
MPEAVLPTTHAALEIEKLSVAYPSRGAWLQALDEVSLAIPPGGVLGLVGESGSGKSTVVLALLGLLGPARVTAQRLAYDGHDLLREAARLRGRRIGVVFQDATATLNPAMKIGDTVTEPMRVHLGVERREAWERGTALLAEMGIPRPAQVMTSYPHQLSGGMKQRVGIATALAGEPELLLLDEPTTALDVTIEAQILSLLDELRAKRGLSMLLVSHNLGIVDRLSDSVSVLYAGRLAETGTTREVLHRSRHPYTKGLLAALPRPDKPHAGRLAPIPGGLPDLHAPEPGCNFKPRCAFAAEGCEKPQTLRGTDHKVSCHRLEQVADLAWPVEPVPVIETKKKNAALPLLEAADMTARFDSGGWLARMAGKATGVLAVDRVSLAIQSGQVVGLVGESGCGKSTLGRLLLRLLPAKSGTLWFGGGTVEPEGNRDFRRRAQVVFQNPETALNPRHTIGTILERAVRWFDTARGDRAVTEEVGRLLELVRLTRHYASRYPHQLSGGEKQRVGIARALASKPEFLICDEAVSALDVSVQAAVLNLLRDLRDELGVAYLFISHDIGVIAHIADRVAVMYHGTIVEEGPVEDVLKPPYHPYTELLLSSVPLIGKGRPAAVAPVGAPPPATSVGCKFAARCPRRIGEICDTVVPPYQHAGGQEVGADHGIRCHIPLSQLAGMPHWLGRRDLSEERVP